MKTTKNYGLKKPESSDFYNVDDFNENADAIDEKLKELETPTYTEATTLTALTSGEKLSVSFGKIAKAVKDFISHINAKATTSGYGHVKLSNSSAVTDETGLALPATEKNAAIGGTLANQISQVNSDLNGYLPLDGGVLSGNIVFPTNYGIRGNIADNDYWRMYGGSAGSNAGFLEIATADDGNEPIYVRQYTGTFASCARTATLLDGNGNTSFPGTVSANGVSTSGGGQLASDGNVYVNSPNNGCVGWLSNLLASKLSTSASCNKNWNWSGQGGQPTWLWGGEDGTNMYVYNPANFNVNYANSCNIAQGVVSTDADARVSVSADACFRPYNYAFTKAKDNAVNLGSGSYRWKQVYAGASSISTSDKNLKDNIQELTDAHMQFLLLLQPVSFTFKDGDSGRIHVGFISQDVEAAMKKVGLTDLDFAGFCKDIKQKVYIKDGKEVIENVLDEDGNPEYIYSLRYEEFIPLNTFAIQKLMIRVNELEKQVFKC